MNPLETTPPDPHAGHGSATPPVGGTIEWLAMVDWVWLTVALVLAACYLAGARRLRGRGDRWPVERTVSWLLGCVTIVAMTSGEVARLGAVRLSWHMVQHMVLSMIVPLLLAFAAPVTLALRALPSTGPLRSVRACVLRALHAPLGRALVHPAVGIGVFVVSLYGLYFSPLLDVLMSSHAGHQLMLMHFLVSGSVLFFALLAADPTSFSNRPGVRLLLLVLTMPLHAFFGVIVMGTPMPLSAHFAATTAALGIDPVADQHVAGGFAWAFGEIPALAAILIIFVQWLRQDRRAAARHDRLADRTGDAELAAYNERLAALSRRR